MGNLSLKNVKIGSILGSDFVEVVNLVDVHNRDFIHGVLKLKQKSRFRCGMYEKWRVIIVIFAD